MVAQQFQMTLDEKDSFQALFRIGYGTGMILAPLLDDLWQGWNKGCASILVLLDLIDLIDFLYH